MRRLQQETNLFICVKQSVNNIFLFFFLISVCMESLIPTTKMCNMELGQSACFPLEENGLNKDPSIPSSHGRPEPIRDADCEAMLPLTFDEVASLPLTWPRAGERPRFMSWHDSNTIIRSWHRASLSEGERAERRVGAGGGSGETAWQDRPRVYTCRQAGKQRGMHTHMDIFTNTASRHTHEWRWEEDGRSGTDALICVPSSTSSWL